MKLALPDGRATEEWIGKTLDEPVPARVKDRVLRRFKFCCANCGRKIAVGESWECDHKQALINHGENRESNLQPLCSICFVPKNAKDVGEKSAAYEVRSKAYGMKERKGPPMPGSRASGWKKKIGGRTVRR